MPFRFRLQKVLDHRQRMVDQKSREVGEAARVVASIQSRMEQVQSEITALLIPATGQLSNVDIREMGRRRAWLEHLENRSKTLAADKAEAAVELASRRADLTSSWRDLEVLQKLKERQKEDWNFEQLRRENQDLDEIGQIRSDRHKREKLTLDQAQLA